MLDFHCQIHIHTTLSSFCTGTEALLANMLKKGEKKV